MNTLLTAAFLVFMAAVPAHQLSVNVRPTGRKLIAANMLVPVKTALQWEAHVMMVLTLVSVSQVTQALSAQFRNVKAASTVTVRLLMARNPALVIMDG